MDSSLLLDALAKLQPADLATYAEAIARRLQHNDSGVRGAAVYALAKLEPVARAKHAAAITRGASRVLASAC